MLAPRKHILRLKLSFSTQICYNKSRVDTKKEVEGLKASARKAEKPKKTPLYLSADKKSYKIMLTVLTFLVLYIACMLIALADSDPDLALGFGISQLAFYIAWLILLIARIRWMCVNRQRPAPLKAMKAFFMWWWRYLALYRAKFHAAPADSSKIEKQIGGFHRSCSGFYAGKDLGDEVTQHYGNLLRLHRKRLKSMGIHLETERKRMVLDGSLPVRTTNARDGKLLHIQAEEHIFGRDTYLKGGRKLYSRKLKGCMHYDIIGANGDGVVISCPCCGNTSPMSVFIDGCPYCGSKYLLEELSQRIGSCHFYRDPAAELKKARIRISAWANRLVFALTLFEFIVMAYSFGGAMLSSQPSMLPLATVLTVMTMIVIFGVLFVAMRITVAPFKLLVRALYTKLREKHSKDMQLARRNADRLIYIHHFNKDFSLNAFFGNIQNKLAAVHYAEAHKQVGVFTNIDLAPFIGQYSTVADCEFESMELTAYALQESRELISVAANLRLMCCEGEKIRFRKERVELQLEKNVVREQKSAFGIHIPKCGKCGAPVDLLNGNTCSWCGTYLNAGKLDWCITAYESKM